MKGNKKYYILFGIVVLVAVLLTIFGTEGGVKNAPVLLAVTPLIYGLGLAVFFAIKGIVECVRRIRKMPFGGESYIKKYYRKIKKLRNIPTFAR